MKLKNNCTEFRYGKIMYIAGDLYIGNSLALYGEYSEGEVECYRQMLKPGNTVVEVGANIGSLTIPLAQIVGETGKVYTFEPQRLVFQLHAGNIALNNLHNVYCYNKGVGEKNEQIRIFDELLDQGGNSGSFQLKSVKEGTLTDIVTLDSLDIPACHLLKIDVEKMEMEVLRGGEQFITRHRPIIYMERDFDLLEEEVNWLKAHDYACYEHNVALFNPNNYFGVTKNIFLEMGKSFDGIERMGNATSFNMIAIPKERNIELKGFKEF